MTRLGISRDVEVRYVSKTFETQNGEQVVALEALASTPATPLVYSNRRYTTIRA